MTTTLNLWTLPLLVGGMSTGVLGLLTWRRRHSPRPAAMSAFLAAITIWILAYFGEVLATDLRGMIWMARIQYVGIAFVGPTWLIFALAYIGRTSLITPGRVVAASALPLVTIVLAWTTLRHELVWAAVTTQTTAAGVVLSPTYGPWFWVNLGYEYACLLVATILLLRSLASQRAPLFEGRRLSLVLGTLAPWMGNILYVADLPVATGIDLSVYGLAGAGVVFGWGVLVPTLIELVPVARSRAIELVDDAVLVIDPSGRIVDANPAARGLLEDGAPLLGMGASACFARHGIDPLDLPAGRTLVDLDVGDPPRRRTFDCLVSILGKEPGTRHARVLTLRDVTESEERKRALEEGREALEAQVLQKKRLEVVGTLAAGVAHDFNNLLTVIGGHAEMAASDLPPGCEARESLAEVLRAADQAGNLVKQILSFTGQVPETRQDVQLGDIARQVQADADVAPATILVDVGPGEDRILGDASQLRHATMNLVSNARDAVAGRPDGLIELLVDRTIPEPGRLPDQLVTTSGDEWLRLRVRDNGSGMQEAVRRRAFEPFFTTKDVGMGSGLGLAAVHGIAMSHDGWVDIASRAGFGTVVTLWLRPASTHHASSTRETPSKEGGRALDILIVDEEENSLRLARTILEGRGHAVRVAKGGREGWRVLQEEEATPGLLLVADGMSGRSGVSMIQDLRDLGITIPAVLMTRAGAGVDAEELEVARVGAVLPKPFGRSELLRAIDRALAAHATGF